MSKKTRGVPADGLAGTWAILRLVTRIRKDPAPYCRRVAEGVVGQLLRHGIRLRDARTLDAGTGGGCLPEALRAAGARSIAVDVHDHRLGDVARTPFVLGAGDRLPFAHESFDVVLSSNVLEHVPNPWEHLAEMVRVCRVDGFVYLSWTNWLSPLGGHEMSPFHYLGQDRALRAYRMTRGRDPRNFPGRSLFVLHVGDALRAIRADPAVELVGVEPRYWPSMRFIARIPGLREVAMWNCVVLLRKQKSRDSRAWTMRTEAGAGSALRPGTPPES